MLKRQNYEARYALKITFDTLDLQQVCALKPIIKLETILSIQVLEMEDKLVKLRSGVVLVKPEEKKVVEESYSEKINQWRKRKRIFKELWDAITENSPKDVKEFKVFHLHHRSLSLYSVRKCARPS